MPRWTDSDNLRGRDAFVVGGPHDGQRMTVNDGPRGLRYPDVRDMTGYVFDRGTWTFRYHGETKTTAGGTAAHNPEEGS